MPTVQGTDDFNHAITTAFYDAVFGSPVSVLSPLYQSQPRSLLIPSAGSTVGVRKNLTGSPARGWAAFPLRYASNPVGGDVVLLGFFTAGGHTARLYLNAGGDLYGAIGASFGASFTLNPNTWYWIEAIYDVSAATHSLYFRVNGVDGATTNAALAASTVAYNQLVSVAGNGTLDWYAGMWKWGSAASASDWLGEPSPGVQVAADFRLPWEIEGVQVTQTLGDLPTSTVVQVVEADAGRAPTVTDDVAAGYSAGDVWIYANTAWWCVSAAAGAAVWKRVTT